MLLNFQLEENNPMIFNLISEWWKEDARNVHNIGVQSRVTKYKRAVLQ